MITPEAVKHIAKLARIELSEADIGALQTELSAILDFAAKLDEAATANVDPLWGGHDLTNATREDGSSISRNNETGAVLVDPAPLHRGGYVEVKAVFNRER